MSVLVWPAELPKPERNTYQSQFQDPRQKRPRDDGPPSYRRRFSKAARLVSMSVLLTRAQKARFDDFLVVDTKMGSLPFTMPDPTKDGWALLDEAGAPVLDDQGAPVLLSGEWLCKFGDAMPTETVIGIEFRISFPIVVMP